MNRTSIAGALLALLLSFSAAPVRGEELVEVSGIKSKIVEPADDHGDLLVSFKAAVRNLTDSPQELEVWIQGIDREDFEVVEVQLFGKFKPKETRELTNMIYVREQTYASVVKWQVEEEPAYDDSEDITSAGWRIR